MTGIVKWANAHHIVHTWSKWMQMSYKVGATRGGRIVERFERIGQQRSCSVCGKTESEYL